MIASQYQPTVDGALFECFESQPLKVGDVFGHDRTAFSLSCPEDYLVELGA